MSSNQQTKKPERKKPRFIREDHHKKVKLGGGWRKPKGLHSKIRHGFCGNPKMVSIGYRTQREFRGLTREGNEIIIVKNIKQLSAVKKGQVIVIAKVGMKKKAELVKKAQELQVTISNVDGDAFLKNVHDALQARREKKGKRVKEEKKKPKEVSIEKKIEEETTEEEKKKKEKEEKDRLLTKKVQ